MTRGYIRASRSFFHSGEGVMDDPDDTEYTRKLRVVVRVQRFLSGALYVSGEVLQALVDENFNLADYILTGAHVNFVERLRERIQYARKSNTPYPPGKVPVEAPPERRWVGDRRTGDDRRQRRPSVGMDAAGAARSYAPPDPPDPPGTDAGGKKFQSRPPTPTGTMRGVFDKVQDSVFRRSSQRIPRPESDGLGAGKKTDKDLPGSIDTVYKETYTGLERRKCAPEDRTGPFTLDNPRPKRRKGDPP